LIFDFRFSSNILSSFNLNFSPLAVTADLRRIWPPITKITKMNTSRPNLTANSRFVGTRFLTIFRVSASSLLTSENRFPDFVFNEKNFLKRQFVSFTQYRSSQTFRHLNLNFDHSRENSFKVVKTKSYSYSSFFISGKNCSHETIFLNCNIVRKSISGVKLIFSTTWKHF
jgi:hypothetical protein